MKPAIKIHPSAMDRALQRLRSEAGAFDLPSIIVGVVVIGILTAGVLASVFGVIPWSQDRAAKTSLGAIRTAEGVALTTGDKYATEAELADKGLLQAHPRMAVGTNTEGTCYVGLMESETGTVFYTTDRNSKPRVYDGSTATGCLANSEIADLMDPLVAYTNQTLVGWASHDLTTMVQEEAEFGLQNGMLSTYVDFVQQPAFPANYADAAFDRESPLLIAWEPYDWSNPSLEQTALRPANIAAGSHDAYITDWLQQAQTYAGNGTIMVRFAPEMNDSIRPWSVGVNGGNTAQDYIDMWRHVYSIKENVAPDVIMVWNPLVAGSDPAGNPVSFSSVFPGSSYVDMLALDGFNWADVQTPGICGWQSYDDVFGGPVAELKALAGDKPWGIAEVASASKPDSYFQAGGPCYDSWGSWVYEWPVSDPYYSTPSDWITQAGWMKTMIQQAHDDGALFVNMFNTAKETDWRLNSTTEGAKVLGIVGEEDAFIFGGQDAEDYVRSALR